MGAPVIFVITGAQACLPNESRVYKTGDLCTAFISHIHGFGLQLR